MKYILCVDTQPRINPSAKIRRYEIEIDELRKKDDVYDSLIITNTGQIFVVRKLGLRDGTTYRLDNEITEQLYYVNIELFDGINYVYIENVTNLTMTLDYVLKNDTFDSYPTAAQMRTAITQTASSIELSVDAKLDDLKAETIKQVDVEYALGISSTVAPTTGWDTVAPAWEDGKYMWQRTVTTFSDNTTETSQPTNISGAKGDKGETGNVGKGISSITEYYAVSNSNSTAPADSSFSTSLQTMTNTNKYLWNYELITYTNNSTEKTSKRVIGVYGNKGDKGDTGNTGLGISSITNKYQVSTSNDTAPTTWLDDPPTMTNTNKYLWNYEIITYTDNTTYSSTPSVIGAYGDKGTNGTDGDDGIGVSQIVEQYYLSTSNTKQQGGSWKNTQDTWTSGKYIWTRSKITWSDNSITYTTPILATGINKANQVADDTNTNLTNNYSTTTQMNAAIQLKANEINSVVSTKVGENEVISKINQSSEQIAISASKIALEGYTTINGGFAIDTNGNASIANGAVVIDNTGIKMADNTQIIGGNGLMTNLFFPALGGNQLKVLGLSADFTDETWKPQSLIIDYSIPQGFTVVKAYITIIEKPVYWTCEYYDQQSERVIKTYTWGYPRAIGIFKKGTNAYIQFDYMGDFGSGNYPETQLTKIFDNNADTWTPTAPSNTSHDTQVKITKNLDTNFFDTGDNGTFLIKVTNIPSSKPTMTTLDVGAQRTALGDAYLNVLGFMAF